MIVDSSAIVSLVLDEDAGPAMAKAIVDAERPRISAATFKGKDFTHTDIAPALA